jgi:cation diffusion facilitator CzcD-associated flavoprotein CzcO
MNHVRVAVIGAGFSGLGTAIKLVQSGRDDFIVLERGPDLGGTWRVNTYPGCACDVPSQVYSFSFELNPDWSHTYARQPEIQAYLLRVAEKYDLRRRVVFNADVTDAQWNGSVWEIETTAGSWTADVLVAGTGGLSEPSFPDIPGLSTFQGTTFHSAQWDHSWTAAGQRVGVIGTGSSAIQFVPHVQREATSLTLFQRTASWVLPRIDNEISDARKSAYRRVPGLQRLVRALVYTRTEIPLIGFRYDRRILKLGEKMGRKLLEEQVSDPVLREKLRPHFDLGCKRVLLSNHYYPALAADNADVVTDRIVQVVSTGVVTEDAAGMRTTHELDALILGTGFAVQDPPIAHKVSVAGGTLAEHWKRSGMSALHGVAVSGFPNLFFLMGPNTALGHNSVLLMIEAQIDHVVKALDLLDRHGLTTIEPRADVQEAYDTRIQRELQPTVWNSGGCNSWYLDEHGRNTVLWPTFTFTYMRQLRDFQAREYVLS